MIRIYVNDILDQGQFPLIDDPPPFFASSLFSSFRKKETLHHRNREIFTTCMVNGAIYPRSGLIDLKREREKERKNK